MAKAMRATAIRGVLTQGRRRSPAKHRKSPACAAGAKPSRITFGAATGPALSVSQTVERHAPGRNRFPYACL